MKGKLTEKQKSLLDGFKDEFFEAVRCGGFFLYKNGYIAAGILKKPGDHGSVKKINKVIIEDVGSTTDHRSIHQIYCAEITFEEAEALYNCLKHVLRIHKTKDKTRKLVDLGEYKVKYYT